MHSYSFWKLGSTVSKELSRQEWSVLCFFSTSYVSIFWVGWPMSSFSCVSSSMIWLLWQLHFDNYWFDLDSICSYLKRLCWAWNETGCHWPPWLSGTQVLVEVGNYTSQYFSAQLYWVNLGVTFFKLIFLLWKHNLIWQTVIHLWCTDILVLWGSELDGFFFSLVLRGSWIGWLLCFMGLEVYDDDLESWPIRVQEFWINAYCLIQEGSWLGWMLIFLLQ